MSILARLNSAFKIGTRINFGFLTVLALLLMIATAGYVGLVSSSDTLRQYEQTSDETLNLLGTDRTLADMRRNATLYSDNGDEQALRRVRDQGKTVRDDLARMEAASRTPERREMVKKIAGLVDRFMADVEEIVKARAERDRALNGVMHPLGEKLRDEIGSVIDSAMKINDMSAATYGGLALDGLMQVRLYSYRFLIEQDPKLLEAAEQHFSKLPSALRRLHEALENPALQAKVREMIKEAPRYLAAFRNAAKMISETNRISEELNTRLSSELAQALTALRTSQSKTMTELK